MKWALYFVLLVFLLGGVVAECSDGQIDINTASESELDEITYVGPATAQSITAKRPFEEVDDLIHVSGIGEIKLAAIKEEGLACVSGEPPEDEKPIEDEEIVQLEDQEKDNARFSKYRNIEEFLIEGENSSGETNDFEGELPPQTIKSNENNESGVENKYAVYGLIVFCILLAFLFFVQRKNGRRKTEFNY